MNFLTPSLTKKLIYSFAIKTGFQNIKSSSERGGKARARHY